MKKRDLFLLFLCTLGVGLVLNTDKSLAVNASDWKPGRIIDDVVFQNKNSMSVQQIQQFLDSKVPTCDRNGSQLMWSGGPTRAQWSIDNGKDPAPYTCLKEYVENPTTKVNNASDPTIVVPGGLSAAQLIYNASQAQNVNPQVYLVLLQKEQSLVTDDWPYTKQFERATGNNCPDTAPCDPAFAWLWTQVNNSGAQFNYYVTHFDEYNYAPGSNNILVHPNGACGTQNVQIENAYTAALYIYTPYVPNQAALNNMYGTGDSCSAYGNRNFWRLFNDWFGPSRQGEFSLVVASDLSDPTQYILLGNRLHAVPSPAVKKAWGLLDNELVYMSPTYLSSLPKDQPLSTLTRPAGTLDVYLVDDGDAYKISSPLMMNAWSLDVADIKDTPQQITSTLINRGNLSYNLKTQASPTIYLMDGGVLRPIQDPKTLIAWEGETPSNTILSSEFVASRGQGATINTYAVKNGTNQYFLVNSNSKTSTTPEILSSLGISVPGVPVVSDLTLARMPNVNFSYFIKSANSNAVYTYDLGTKRQMQDPAILSSWSIGSNVDVTTVTTGHLDFLSNGSVISSYLMSDGSNTYLLDGVKIPINAERASDLITSPITNVSPALASRYSTSVAAKRFYKDKLVSQQAIYLIMDGLRYHITSPSSFTAWGGNSENITLLSTGALGSYFPAGSIGTTVSNSSTSYLVDSGRMVQIAPEVVSSFGSAVFTQVPNSLVTELSIDQKLLSGAIDGNTADYLLSEGVLYVSPSAPISSLWNLGSGPYVSDIGIARFSNRPTLTKFVKSTSSSDLRIFIKDQTKLYTLTSPSQVLNLGYDNSPYVRLSPGIITSTETEVWSSVVASDAAGQYFVFDNGTRRTFADIATRDQWMQSSTGQPIISTNLLSTFSQSGVIRKSIKGTGPEVFAVVSIRKKHVTSPATYLSTYAPYSTVSDRLLVTLPSADPI